MATAQPLESAPTDAAKSAAPNPPSAQDSGAEPKGGPCCPPELAEVLPKARDAEVIGHVQVIVSLLEGRPVSLEEIWEALLHFWRQRTIGRRPKIDQIIAWLNTHPP
jgi:hypothetical protein